MILFIDIIPLLVPVLCCLILRYYRLSLCWLCVFQLFEVFSNFKWACFDRTPFFDALSNGLDNCTCLPAK